MPWSGVGGNPPPLKDDLGPPAHQPSPTGVAGRGGRLGADGGRVTGAAVGVAVRGGLSRSAPVTYIVRAAAETDSL